MSNESPSKKRRWVKVEISQEDVVLLLEGLGDSIQALIEESNQRRNKKDFKGADDLLPWMRQRELLKLRLDQWFDALR